MQTLEDLIKLVDKIKAKDSDSDWHSVMIVKKSDGIYALYERSYSPDYGARSSNWQVSQNISTQQALELYVTLKDKSISGQGWYNDDMKEALVTNRDFVLSHYSDAELKDYMKRRKSGVINEKKEEITKEKVALQKQIEDLQSQIANLNTKEGLLYEV